MGESMEKGQALGIKISFSWKFPQKYTDQFREFNKIHGLHEGVNFELENLHDSILQIFSSLDDFETTAKYRRITLGKGSSSIFQKLKIPLIKHYLRKQRLIPHPFPDDGVFMYQDIVFGEIEDVSKYEELAYFDEIDPKITMNFKNGGKNLVVHFPTEECLIKTVMVVFADFLKIMS